MSYGIMKILIPVWGFVAAILILVAFSHLLFSSLMENGDKPGTRLDKFGLRLFSALFWPLIIISKPGRKFIVESVKGLF